MEDELISLTEVDPIFLLAGVLIVILLITKPHPKEPFKISILRVVNELGGSAYGLTIMDKAKDYLGHTPSLGAIYVALYELEQDGFITTYRWESDREVRGGRNKRMAVITRFGEQELDRLSKK